MRKLWLIFTLTINTGLVFYAAEGVAKVSSKTTHSSGKVHSHSFKKHKGHKVRTKIVTIYRPKDVWERIRLGMQANIPNPPVVSKPEHVKFRAETDIDQLLKVSAVQFRLSKFHDFSPSTLNIGLNQSRQTIKQAASSGVSVGYRTTIGQTINTPLKIAASDVAGLKSQSNCKPSVAFSGFKVKPDLNKPTFNIRHDDRLGEYQLHKVPYFPSQVSPSDEQATCHAGVILAAQSVPVDLNHQMGAMVAPEVANDAVARIDQQINFFTKRTSYLREVSERASPYLYHIVDTLSNRNMPLELALLPIVESAFKATAQSPKNAAGLWQFIPSTGKAFALKQDDEYDERLDIGASTDAAVRFLSQLNKHYRGDWLLALAAYNSGQGRVDAAIKSNLAQGLPSDYWSLPLPAETKVYVPRLLALATIFANPTQYHVNIKPINNAPYFVKVNIDKSAEIQQLASKDLREVAVLADFSYEQFMQLNPGYLKSTLSETGPYQFLMPAINANRLQQQLAYLAQAEIEQHGQSPFLQTKFSDDEKSINTAKSGTAQMPSLNPI